MLVGPNNEDLGQEAKLLRVGQNRRNFLRVINVIINHMLLNIVCIYTNTTFKELV